MTRSIVTPTRFHDFHIDLNIKGTQNPSKISVNGVVALGNPTDYNKFPDNTPIISYRSLINSAVTSNYPYSSAPENGVTPMSYKSFLSHKM